MAYCLFLQMCHYLSHQPTPAKMEDLKTHLNRDVMELTSVYLESKGAARERLHQEVQNESPLDMPLG